MLSHDRQVSLDREKGTRFLALNCEVILSSPRAFGSEWTSLVPCSMCLGSGAGYSWVLVMAYHRPSAKDRPCPSKLAVAHLYSSYNSISLSPLRTFLNIVDYLPIFSHLSQEVFLSYCLRRAVGSPDTIHRSLCVAA
jgi:hypothetical protein